MLPDFEICVNFKNQIPDLYNLYNEIVNNPGHFRQLRCGESLITIFNCPIAGKYMDNWCHYNYVVYVMEGRKIWHTPHGSYELNKGSCVLVRKGANIVEQFFDSKFCVVLFFVPDDFIRDVLKTKSTPIYQPSKTFEPVIAIETTSAIQQFYLSMLPHFEASREPDRSLLELKFRELVLTIADNPVNSEVISWFCHLMQEPQSVSLQRVMEENFYYNLKLEEFARLSSRSLSAFKRDFVKLYETSPGKWLLEKRLNYARHLLANLGKTVAETAFESGFENASHFSRAFRQRFGTSPASLKYQGQE